VSAGVAKSQGSADEGDAKPGRDIRLGLPVRRETGPWAGIWPRSVTVDSALESLHGAMAPDLCRTAYEIILCPSFFARRMWRHRNKPPNFADAPSKICFLIENFYDARRLRDSSQLGPAAVEISKKLMISVHNHVFELYEFAAF
jgi:hypothetical protein